MVVVNGRQQMVGMTGLPMEKIVDILLDQVREVAGRIMELAKARAELSISGSC
jgi:hypothetical protein